MDVRQYWQDVAIKIQEISPKFPEGVVYLVSRHNREKNTTAGMICTATVDHAAECLVNNTHDLATPEQISAYKAAQERAKQGIMQAEVGKKQQYFVVVNGEEAAAKGLPVEPVVAESGSRKASR